MPLLVIFKVLKRDIYPTVDLIYENNYTMIDHYFMGMAPTRMHDAGLSHCPQVIRSREGGIHELG